MKIIIPGGSGQIGKLLARTFTSEGHEVVVLTRQVKETQQWKQSPWDAESLGSWTTELDGADVVVNLAGRSVNCRYGKTNRQAIMDSRVNSTRVIGQAIAQSALPPRVWLQMSTATIYSHRLDAPNDENTGIIGGKEAGVPDTWKFSIDVALAWERALEEAGTPQTRKVKLRSAMVMSPDRGGIFDTLLGLVRKGLGGTAGDGRQFVSWIHGDDFVQAIKWIIERDSLMGAVNLASPQPLPNAEFMRILRQAWGTRIGLPASKWMLEFGAIFLQTETELILKSRRVIPTRLLQQGFTFQFPTWHDAAKNLCQRWREGGLRSGKVA